jgi:hypothetical protein
VSEPGLTVIVVALLGGEATEACLASLASQADDILVVERDGSIRDGAGAVVGSSPTGDVPGRRRAGVECARTPIVALLEDMVTVAPGWAQAVLAGFSDPAVAGVGGPVSMSPSLPAPVRALVLTEYGRFQAPKAQPAGLPGCNFAFRRDALIAVMPDEGLIDGEVFARLAANGHKLGWAPGMAVTYSAAFFEGAALSTRFNHGRLYASRLLADTAFPGRAVAAAKSLLLPAVLTARTLSEAQARDLRSPATLAHVALQHGAWAMGELAAALFGPPAGGVGAWH